MQDRRQEHAAGGVMQGVRRPLELAALKSLRFFGFVLSKVAGIKILPALNAVSLLSCTAKIDLAIAYTPAQPPHLRLPTALEYMPARTDKELFF
jgi:hypothetical protein